MKIARGTIVDGALGILDEEGLGGLSMRRVAERLGVRASALYWHVQGREELIGLMAGSFYARAFEKAPHGEGWRAWLRGYGHAFHAILLSHRDSAHLCALARPSSQDPESMDRLAAPLVAVGLPRRTALSYQASVISLALGWAVYEQSPAMHAHLAEAIGFEESFTIGLDAIVAGFPDPVGAPPSG